MKNSWLKFCFFIAVFFSSFSVFAQSTDTEKLASWNENVTLAGQQYQLTVSVFQKTEEGQTVDLWSEWLIDSANGQEKLNCDPSSMLQVSEIKASSDGRFLAIVSVGEGHPILDIVDLAALITRQQCKNIWTINPYPSYITIEKWVGNKLIVNSGSLLTHKVDDQFPIEFFDSEKFSLDLQTQTIEGVSKNAKNPIPYFINMLSDSENKILAANILAQLKAQSAIPYLKKMLEKETNPDAQDQLRNAINQLSH